MTKTELLQILQNMPENQRVMINVNGVLKCIIAVDMGTNYSIIDKCFDEPVIAVTLE